MTPPVSTRLLCYDEAITALNGLQTNAKVLEKIKAERDKNKHLNLLKTQSFLQETGVTLDQLDNLNVIHVSGTKGKGSTCAFTESILLRYGYKTGFFSSPHLVTATERIRINGQPLPQEKFTKYFWSVYEKICTNGNDERPPYFQFLTILAFNVFLKEEVDVAIMECGIGGTYDHTNVVKHPVITAITAQGVDHKSLLGATIKENCSHKAGIMKAGVPAFVDHSQPVEAMEVINDRAQEVGAEVYIVPNLKEYSWAPFPPCQLGLAGKIQHRNAAIALQIARHFVRTREDPRAEVQCSATTISLNEALGLRLCVWPGRSQIVRMAPDVTLYLDSAHTKESSEACAEWVSLAFQKTKENVSSTFKVLMFNVYDERKAEDMLQSLIHVGFDHVIFCTNFTRRVETAVSDNTNLMATLDGQIKKCHENQKALHNLKADTPSVIIPYLNDALRWITQNRSENIGSSYFAQFENQPLDVEEPLPKAATTSDHLQILVTGSTHLVGGILEAVRPNVFELTDAETKEMEQTIQAYQDLNQSYQL